jgi:hypothetical protein
VRAIGVDRLARGLKALVGVRYRIIGIPHYAPTPRFAEHVLQEIEEQTEGNLVLRPDNCVVICSTEGVIGLYEGLGFSVLTAELTDESQPDTPMDLLKRFVEVGEGWTTDTDLQTKLSKATFELWHDFPDIPRRILRLWRDPLLNDEGSLTDSRDYASYAYLMGNSEIITLKYQDIQQAIVPGKIVDEGCGDGALLVPIGQERRHRVAQRLRRQLRSPAGDDARRGQLVEPRLHGAACDTEPPGGLEHPEPRLAGEQRQQPAVEIVHQTLPE